MIKNDTVQKLRDHSSRIRMSWRLENTSFVFLAQFIQYNFEIKPYNLL